jgi:hypothetical protein
LAAVVAAAAAAAAAAPQARSRAAAAAAEVLLPQRVLGVLRGAGGVGIGAGVQKPLTWPTTTHFLLLEHDQFQRAVEVFLLHILPRFLRLAFVVAVRAHNLSIRIVSPWFFVHFSFRRAVFVRLANVPHRVSGFCFFRCRNLL